MKCVLIGNGPSALNKENGKYIDTFDTVVRFNLFHVDGYEKWVGTKTNIWFNVRSTKEVGEWRLSSKYDLIYIHTWVWKKKSDLVYNSFIEYYKDSEQKILKTEKVICEEISKLIPNESYDKFSTGLIAIWIMLKTYEKVFITGFDWWDDGKHHYGDDLSRGFTHKPLLEKKVIDILKSKGKIEFI